MIMPLGYALALERQQLLRRQRLTKKAVEQLLAKGMVAGHGKFDEVVRRKVSRWMRKGH